jgi:hypothetical protein
MHKAALLLALALSLVKRVENGAVVNRWEPFQDLYKCLKDSMTYIFGKQTKRFADFEKLCKSIDHCFVARLPNDTRVAGCWNLMKDSLRLMFMLTHFGNKNKEFLEKSLSKLQWEQLAQFEAIISSCGKLCFNSQSNRVECGGEMVLELALLKDGYDHDETYGVVDVGVNFWSAKTPFDSLPRVKMAISEEVAEKMGGIP